MRARSDELANTGLAPSKALVRAVRLVLRPLVRLLIEKQVPYPYLTDLLKSVYVEVAERDLGGAGRSTTDSRISLLTGVHRREVKRLRSRIGEADEVPAVVSLGGAVVARWHAEPEFLDDQGNPRPLPVHADGEPSFETLVTSVSKDIRPRSVLDEWLRLGAIRFDTRGRVVLDSGVFVPREGVEEKLHYLGRNLHDHLATAVRNVLGDEPPHVERSVHYGRLSPESVREIAEFSADQAMVALKAVNRRACELQERDADGRDAKRRINFGVYLFEADSTDDEDRDD